MAISYGFYNSNNHDRLYSAEQFGSIFDGLIHDGVYAKYGKAFAVVPKSGMSVYVQSGRAWFNHTWTLNDADNSTYITLDDADIQYARYDAIVLRVNKTNRANSITKKTGTPAATPTKPTMTKNATMMEYPLAYIKVPRNANAIGSANIESAVGSSECPWVVGIISEPQSVSGYIDAFKAAVEESLNAWKQQVLTEIEQEYAADEDDLGYAASIANLRNELSGAGGALDTHNKSATAHNSVINPIKQDVKTLKQTTVPNLTDRVDTLSDYLKTEPPRFSTNSYALQWPARTWAVYDIGPNTTGTGKPDASKMGNYVLVFTRTTNTSTKYNVQIAFGTKYTMAMRCKNGSTTWGAWKYYTFK